MRISVFLLTYNREIYLKKTIISILNQTFSDFQLIILDNHSTDNTSKIVNEFNDNRIKYIRHTSNIGPVNNANYAINFCNTEYFILFHDDDLMENNMLERQLNYMDRFPQTTVLSTSEKYIDSNGDLINKLNSNLKFNNNPITYQGNYISNFLKIGIKYKGFVCPSVIYRSIFFKNNPSIRFEIDCGPAYDQFMWFQIERHGGVLALLNEELMYYRIHSSQDSMINNDTMLIDLFYYLKKINYYNVYLSKYYISIFYRMALAITKLNFLKKRHKLSSNSYNFYKKKVSIVTGSKILFKFILLVIYITRYIKFLLTQLYLAFTN